MIGEIKYGVIKTDDLILNDVELAARLKVKVGYTDETISFCRQRLEKVIECRYSAILTEVLSPCENAVDIGFGCIKSQDLYKTLTGCRCAYVFASTIGIEVDRLLMKLYYSSPAEHFITDAIASAYAEAAAQKVDDMLRGENASPMRFSPGYGDFPLEFQPKVIDFMNARRLLGISVSKSLMMTPKKSVTAIAGVLDVK